MKVNDPAPQQNNLDISVDTYDIDRERRLHSLVRRADLERCCLVLIVKKRWDGVNGLESCLDRFQITDDVLDLVGEEDVVGNWSGVILKREITLPVIIALNDADEKRRGMLLELIAARDLVGLVTGARERRFDRTGVVRRRVGRNAK